MIKHLKVRAMFVFILVIILVLSTTIISNANSDDDEHSIWNRDDFIEALSDAELDGKVTATEKRILISETDPLVISEFIVEKLDIAENITDNIDPIFKEQNDGSFAYTETFDLGDSCSVEVSLTEGEDLSTIKTISKTLSNFLVEPVYAASNGEEISKPFGNRYFTASHRVTYPFGWISFTLENHYTVKATGLTERYGIASYRHGFGTGTGFSCGNPQIVKASAPRIDQSVRIDCTYRMASGAGGITGTLNYNMQTTATHRGLNPNNTMQVQHKWKWEAK